MRRLLNRILYWLGVEDHPDPSWRSTGYTVRYLGHDEAQEIAAAARRDKVAAAKRKLEAERGQP